METRAIQTEYNGYKFRSRLEAKWAVFFDTVGIKYQYEPEGYEGENGKRYLPDFYLPDYKTYVEVKGDEEQYRKDLPRMVDCIKGDDAPIKRLLILGNIPYSKEANGVYWYPVLYYHPLNMNVMREYKAILDNSTETENQAFIALDWITPNYEGNYQRVPLWENPNEPNPVYRGTISREHLDPIPDEVLEPLGEDIGNGDRTDAIREFMGSAFLVAAYRKAKQARFEYGETPSATDA